MDNTKQRFIVIGLASQAAMYALAAKLREISMLDVSIEIIDTDSCFNGQKYEEIVINETAEMRLGMAMHKLYDPKDYVRSEHRTGKGRNKGKNNREWWNK